MTKKNGYWNIIETVNDLPTESGKYWVTFTERGIEKICMMQFACEQDWCKDHWLKNYSAWQPVIKPDPYVNKDKKL